MTRGLLLLVPTAAVAAALLAGDLRLLPRVLVAALVGAVAAVLLWRVQDARIRTIAHEVNSWLGGDRAALELHGGQHWRQLAVALNALGASHERRDRRLDRTRSWRRQLVGSIEGPALLFSAEEHLVAANRAARRSFGISGDDPELTLVQALGTAALVAAAREAASLRRPVQVDTEADGRDLRVTASAIGDEVLVIVSDRTDLRRVEELRRDFVANASHELKTPATAISALADALAVGHRSGSARTPELVARLQEESERLVRMVRDLLDLRRLEEGAPGERAVVDLAAVARGVVDELRPRAAERDVRVQLDLPEQANVAGIEQDLRLVVDNLVANAIEYNQPGGEVAVALRPEDGSHVLTVRDTGIGIPRRDLERVFERFYRVDVARSRARGGTGLGLSIVRHAVERHGGSVAVDSLLGEGSTFTVRLPIEPVGRAPGGG